jgi:hypothetical protein
MTAHTSSDKPSRVASVAILFSSDIDGLLSGGLTRPLLPLTVLSAKRKTHPPEISGGWVDTTRSWLDKYYSTISLAPDGFMPQQQRQVNRPIWQ